LIKVKEKSAKHDELHRGKRTGWLRAATLGANDGLISTSSLVVGVASAGPTKAAILLAAVAGLVAGASLIRGSLRVAFWGAVAMGCTAAIGHLFGAVI
jgi:VIT family.